MQSIEILLLLINGLLTNVPEYIFVIALIPILGVRPFWNVLVYNEIHNTDYLYGESVTPSQMGINIGVLFIFWWFKHKADTEKVRKYKRIGNIISVSAVIWIIGWFAFYYVNTYF